MMKPERWKQVDELFSAVLDLDPDKRAAFLDEVCTGDEALRKEVETLLASDGQPDSFIESPPLQVAAELITAQKHMVSPGESMGPYKILSLLGTGGMGEVYRARDARLNRDIAIKVLPAQFLEDTDRLKRFKQEAQSASALNHPNIITIHDIGSFEGGTYIAMELIEGKTLREILKSGSLPLRKIVQIGAQLTDGLAKAHEAGIVHRDLKPENFMISKDGFAKILDFGLAKPTGPMTNEASQLSTREQTRAGTVMGTSAYMSPEQAVGQAVDFRSDQFSFGIVLYEMITGTHPFHRKTTFETLSAIVNEEPKPIALLNPQCPPPIRWIVERCMAKNREDRYVSTRDLAREIQSLRDHFSEAVSSVEDLPAAGSLGKKKPLHAILTVALAVAVIALGSALLLLSKKAGKAQEFQPLSYHRLTYRRGYVNSAVFAADGQTIVYSAAFQGQPTELFLTRTEGVESRPLGISNARILSISPSGEMAILLAKDVDEEGTLAQVPLSGGSPREIADHVTGAGWSPDGSNLVIARRVSGRSRLEYPSGKVIYESPNYIRQPKFSPDGKVIAFHEHPFLADYGSVIEIDLQGQRKAASKVSYPQGIGWAPSGNEVLFTTGGPKTGGSEELWALGISDKERLIQRFPNATLRDISPSGRILIDSVEWRGTIIGLFNGEARQRDLSWLDGSGLVDLSADGKMIVIAEGGAGGELPVGTIYLRKTDGSPAIRLGPGVPGELSSDGQYVLGFQPDPYRLILYPTGAGEEKSLRMEDFEKIAATSLLPDRTRILFAGRERGHSLRAYLQDIAGGKPHPITADRVLSESFDGAVSPDGKVFFGRGTDHTIYLYSIAGDTPIQIPEISANEWPLQWSSDGNSIYVLNSEILPWRIYKLNIQSRKRTLIKELMPSDLTGVTRIDSVRLTPDEKSFVYSYGRILSTLYLVDGMK